MEPTEPGTRAQRPALYSTLYLGRLPDNVSEVSHKLPPITPFSKTFNIRQTYFEPIVNLSPLFFFLWVPPTQIVFKLQDCAYNSSTETFHNTFSHIATYFTSS